MNEHLAQFLQSAAEAKENQQAHLLTAADFIRDLDESEFTKPVTKEMFLYVVLWMVKNKQYPTITLITRTRKVKPEKSFDADAVRIAAIKEVSKDPPSKLDVFARRVTEIVEQAQKDFHKENPVMKESYQEIHIQCDYLGKVIPNSWEFFMKTMASKLIKMKNTYQVTDVV